MPRVVFDLYARGEQQVAHAFRTVAGASDDARLKSEHLGSAWSGLKKTGAFAAGGAALVGAGIIGAAATVGAMTDDIIGLNLQVAKARNVFGSEFRRVDQTLARTASNFGLTKIEAEGLAGTVAGFAKQAGFTTKAAADMSLQFVDLTGKVKLMSAGQFDSEQASEALSAAFRGEYDSLQRVVPSISAARIQQVALGEAHVKNVTEFNKLTFAAQQQANMLAVLKIVQDGTSAASGLMATEQGKQALAVERSRTKIREQWQEIERNLLPAVSTLWQAFSEQLNPQLKAFNRYVSSPEGQAAMASWARGFGKATAAAGQFVGTLDDVQLTVQQLAVEANIAWLKIGLGVRKMTVEIYKAMEAIPGMGDRFKRAAAVAQTQVDRIQSSIDGLNTDASRLEIQRLQLKINSLHGKVVDAKTDPRAKAEAVRQIADLQHHIDQLRGHRVTISATAVYYGDGSQRRIRPDGTLGPIMRNRGGSIGDGRGYHDEVDVKATRGEHMLTTDDVAAMGGHAGVYQFRASLHGGRQPQRMATGGEVVGTGPVMRAVEGSLDAFTRRLTDKLVRNLDVIGMGAVRGWQRQWAIIHRAFPWAQLISSYRANAITVSGNRSYHALGRAIDISPSMAIFDWIRGHYGRNTKELIYSPAGSRQIKNGQPHYYTGAVRAMHFNHVHWAMDGGGVANGPGIMVKPTKLPERVLSPRQTTAFDLLVRNLDRGGGAGGPVTIVFPNYIGTRDELVRTLVDLDRQGKLSSLALRR